MNAETLITISEYTQATQAQLVRGELQASGIEAFIHGENALNAMPNTALMGNAIQLQVRASDEQKAREVLRRKRRSADR